MCVVVHRAECRINLFVLKQIALAFSQFLISVPNQSEIMLLSLMRLSRGAKRRGTPCLSLVSRIIDLIDPRSGGL